MQMGWDEQSKNKLAEFKLNLKPNFLASFSIMYVTTHFYFRYSYDAIDKSDDIPTE